MITFEPAISITTLSLCAPGALVQLGDALGFVATSANDPDQTLLFVHLDASSRFVHHVPDQSASVISYGTELVIRPAFRTFSPEFFPGRDSKSQLILSNGSPHIVVHLPQWQTRLLNLSTGLYGGSSNSLESAFRDWEIGVRNVDRTFVPLITVASGAGSA
jgi:hypothetical protein